MLGTNYHHHISDQSERVIRHINIESNQFFVMFLLQMTIVKIQFQEGATRVQVLVALSNHANKA